MASSPVGVGMARIGRATGRARRAFRRWRRGRPFWGGLFTLLGGAEILLLPALHLPLLIQVGIAGISGLIAGILMVVMGLAVWVAPQYRVFAGIATILFSLASFLTSNLGGFLLGMLLGLLGGSLCCAWTPVRPGTGTGSGPDAPPPAGPPDGTGESAVSEPGPAVDGPAEHVPSGPAEHALDPADHGPEPAQDAPEPAEHAPEPAEHAPEPAEQGSEPAEHAPEPAQHPAEPAEHAPGGTERPADTAVRRSLRAGGVALPLLLTPVLLTPAAVSPVPVSRPAAASLPVVGSVVPAMRASSVDMSGLSFDGVVEVPTRDGPLRALEFSMGQVVMHDYALAVPGGPDGGALALSIDTLALGPDVTFLTTRMSGRLAGVLPVTFTPDAPPLLVPPTATFTDFESEQVFVHSGRLVAGGLRSHAGDT